MGTQITGVAVVAAIGLLGGCSLVGEDAGSTTSSTRTAAPSSPTGSSTTGSAAETTVVTALPTDVDGYADGFVRAWGIGDRPEAERFGTDDAVTAVFDHAGRGGDGWSRDATTVQGSRTQVRFTDDDLVLYVLVDTDRAAAGEEDAVVGASIEFDGQAEPEPQTETVTETATATSSSTATATAAGLPRSTGEYADRFVRAWGTGDRAKGDPYATESILRELFDVYGPGGGGWSRTSTAARQVDYTDTDGVVLRLHINHEAVAEGRQDAIYMVELFG